ncbi:flagellin [Bacillus anthracis]|uniref:flagellin N-terminal helical domain-containing protein n=1 Tax=Bacillus TaxID=1386 RepID=UPI000BF6B3AC|nr:MULTISPECIES: flagellin [Bacillus]PFW38618.1 flagellin [Bacillus anthracis]PGQ83512.1 flagellin [Bacillus anthracis]PGS97038.1 flagellin [Bacillus anthracis]PHA10072.1 flagellin [Bacillus sp. AFS051223]
MRINTNINSLRTQEYMRQNQAKMSNAMDRLSSGKRINNASDDAAGLAIATRMRARESGLNVASNNTQDGMSLIRTADSALNSVSNILLRMRDLANQSANGTNTDKNQAALQKEFSALQDQIKYISENTQFNDQSLLDSTDPNSPKEIRIQTLDSNERDKQIVIKLNGASQEALGIKNLTIDDSTVNIQKHEDIKNVENLFNALKGNYANLAGNDADQKAIVDAAEAAYGKIKAKFTSSGVDTTALDKTFTEFTTPPTGKTKDDAVNSMVSEFGKALEGFNKAQTKENSLNSIEKIDNALKTIADNRATLGATLNRLDFNVNNLKSQSASMASAASQIEDADMAKEMSEMTKFKILNEAGISMLSQANQTPQMVSKLLQ